MRFVTRRFLNSSRRLVYRAYKLVGVKVDADWAFVFEAEYRRGAIKNPEDAHDAPSGNEIIQNGIASVINYLMSTHPLWEASRGRFIYVDAFVVQGQRR